MPHYLFAHIHTYIRSYLMISSFHDERASVVATCSYIVIEFVCGTVVTLTVAADGRVGLFLSSMETISVIITCYDKLKIRISTIIKMKGSTIFTGLFIGFSQSHKYTHTYACTCKHTHTDMHMHTHTCAHTHTPTHMHTHTHAAIIFKQ